MVFIGPQSSGKSTIAKLLAIFRDIDFIIEGYKEENVTAFFQNYNIANYFQESSFLEYKTSDYTISFTNNEWNISKTAEFDQNIVQEKIRIEELIKGVVSTNERLKTTPEAQDEFIRQLYNLNWRKLFQYHKEQIYIPAERILTSIISESGFSFNEISLPGTLKQFGKEFERAKLSKEKIEIPFLNISYQYEEKEFRIYYSKNKSVALNESSSGVQSLLPLYTVMNYVTKNVASKNCFIVEEPELNLFPVAQKATINFLIEKANHQNELLITTHSPYVLSVLNNLLFAHIIGSKGEKLNASINEIIPESLWIEPNNFNAYYLESGVATNLINPNTKLIKDNFLDKVSEDIIGERDQLLELYKISNAKPN